MSVATITKRADELVVGNVVVTPSHRLVVTQIETDGFVWVARSGEPYAPLANVRFQESVEVESSTLSPAQQHAEELLDVARRAAKLFDAHNRASEFVDEVNALLAKIDPPAPPTLEEALEMLNRAWKAGDAPHGTGELLDRARRAGVLKS